jgi:hypothetical protein
VLHVEHFYEDCVVGNLKNIILIEKHFIQSDHLGDFHINLRIILKRLVTI